MASSLLALNLLLLLLLHNVSGDLECNPNRDAPEALLNGATDVVVVRQENGDLLSTRMHVQIGKFNSFSSLFQSREGKHVSITINGIESPVKMTVTDSGNACFLGRGMNRYSLSPAEWERFKLRPGGNLGAYKVPDLDAEIRFIVYLFDQSTRLVISDIDGTITTSDISGKVLPYFGARVDHEGVVELYHKKAQSGLQFLYLTARPIGDDEDTRDYLFDSLQNLGGFSLPYGPVLLNPKTLTEAAFDGLMGPQRQKKITLDQLFSLFEFGPEVVESAYGNKETDTRAYLMSGIAPEKIFIVNEEGVLKNEADGRISSYPREAQLWTEKEQRRRG